MNLLFPPAFSCWNVKVYIRGVHRSLSIDEKSWESSLKQRGLPASPRQRSAKEMVKIGELRKLLQGTRHHHQQGKSCQPWGPVRRAERTPFGPLTFTVSTPSLAMAWEGLGVTEGISVFRPPQSQQMLPKGRCPRSRRTGAASRAEKNRRTGEQRAASQIGRTLPELEREWQLSSTERDTFCLILSSQGLLQERKKGSHSERFCRQWQSECR